jgi:hypothetical protein
LIEYLACARGDTSAHFSEAEAIIAANKEKEDEDGTLSWTSAKRIESLQNLFQAKNANSFKTNLSLIIASFVTDPPGEEVKKKKEKFLIISFCFEGGKAFCGLVFRVFGFGLESSCRIVASSGKH